MSGTGAGSIVLCTYPLEHMAAMTPRVNPEATSTLYDALAAYAGVSRLVTVGDPRIAADVMVRSDGTRFAWLVSQAAESVTVKPQLAAGLRLCQLGPGPAGGTVTPADGAVALADGAVALADGTVTLDPFGVSVFALLDAGD